MLILRSFLITAVFGAGIAVVLWLVSLITGHSNISLIITSAIAFLVAWGWAYLSMKECRSKQQKD